MDAGITARAHLTVVERSTIPLRDVHSVQSTSMLKFSDESILRIDYQVAVWADAASGALLTYDYLCTLDIEVSYVWAGPWTMGKCLFILNRYLPFVDTFIDISLSVGDPSPETCQIQGKVATWFMVIGIMIAEVVLMLRTYGIWERRRSILITLTCNFLFTCIPALVITQLQVAAHHFTYSPYPGFVQCPFKHIRPSMTAMMVIPFILLVCSETLIVMLTMIKAVQRFQLLHSGPSWIVQLFHDGLIFYIYILCISILSILLPLLASGAFLNVLSVPLRVLHSILCTRVLFVIFRLRSTDSSTSMLALARPVV